MRIEQEGKPTVEAIRVIWWCVRVIFELLIGNKLDYIIIRQDDEFCRDWCNKKCSFLNAYFGLDYIHKQAVKKRLWES